MWSIDLSHGRALRAEPRRSLACAAFSQDGAHVALAEIAGALEVWRVSDAVRIASTSVPEHDGLRGVTTVAFSPSGETILSSEPAGLTLRDALTLRERHAATHARPRHLGFGGKGRFAVCDASVVDVPSLSLASFIRSDPDVTWDHACADVDGDGVLLFRGRSGDEAPPEPAAACELILFARDLTTVRRRRAFAADDGVSATAFDHRHRRFVFATRKGEIVAWWPDGSREEVLARANGVTRLFCFDDASAALVGTSEWPRRLLWWSGCFEGEPVAIEPPREELLAASRDGRTLLCGHELVDLSIFGLPRKRLLVTPAQLEDLGFEWPRHSEVANAAEPARDEGGRIDLDTLAANLAWSIDTAKRRLSEMYTFARTWGAAIDDTTDQRDAMVETRDRFTAALAHVDAIRAAARARWPLTETGTRPPRDAADGALAREVLRAMADAQYRIDDYGGFVQAPYHLLDEATARLHDVPASQHAAILAAIDDADEEIRRAAARAIAELRIPGGAGALARRLADPALWVRWTCARLLPELAPARALELLLPHRDLDTHFRDAAKAYVTARGVEAIDVLDANDIVPEASGEPWALPYSLEPERTARIFERKLSGPGRAEWTKGVMSIVLRHGGDWALPFARASATSGDPFVAGASGEVLAAYGRADDLDAILSAFRAAPPDARRRLVRAAFGLGKRLEVPVAARLLEVLSSDVEEQRAFCEEAAGALSWPWEAASRPAIEEAIARLQR